MTGKTKEMSKIKQLLIMHRDGASNRSIARVLGMDKETVNNYVNKAKALPEGLEGLLRLEDPELGRRLHSGNAAYSDPRFNKFREMLPYIEGELRRKGVTLRLLWEEYRAEHPEGYGLRSSGSITGNMRRQKVPEATAPSSGTCTPRGNG